MHFIKSIFKVLTIVFLFFYLSRSGVSRLVSLPLFYLCFATLLVCKAIEFRKKRIKLGFFFCIILAVIFYILLLINSIHLILK